MVVEKSVQFTGNPSVNRGPAQNGLRAHLHGRSASHQHLCRIISQLVGVGGIGTGRDAAEMLMAGASAVQVCTEAILRGTTVYSRIARELDTFLDDHGYASVDEITGRTVRLMRQRSGALHSVCPPRVNIERCVQCGSCAKICPHEAIHVDHDSKTLKIDEEKCSSCGLCLSRCKLRALTMAQ